MNITSLSPVIELSCIAEHLLCLKKVCCGCYKSLNFSYLHSLHGKRNKVFESTESVPERSVVLFVTFALCITVLSKFLSQISTVSALLTYFVNLLDV